MGAFEIIGKQPEEDAAAVADALDPEFVRTGSGEEYREEVETFATQASNNLGVQPNFAVMSPQIREHVDQYGGDRIVGINETTQADINDVIMDGFERGKNPRAIAESVGAYVTDIIPNRGEVIARTEMLRASNFGTYQAHKTSGVVTEREWIATPDTRTRDHHSTLDGTVVGMDEKFTSPETGAEAKYPGDFGRGVDDIQCRCTTGARVPDRSYDRRAVWKQFDDRLSESEDKFAELFTDLLRRQIVEQASPVMEERIGVGVAEVLEET